MTDFVVAEGTWDGMTTCGCVTWWRLEGGLRLQILREAWEAEGLPLDALPPATSHAAALRRAVQSIALKDVLARPIKAFNERPAGWALVREEQVNGELTYSTVLECWLNPIGQVTFKRGTNPRESVEYAIQHAYSMAMLDLQATDVGSWLAYLVQGTCDAVSLRAGGGVYFVPAHKLGTWNAIIDCVNAASSHCISTVQALRADDAIEAFLNALQQEVQDVCTHTLEELQGEGIGKRAASHRVRRMEALSAKLTAYEALLGKKLPELSTQITEVTALGTAMMLKGE